MIYNNITNWRGGQDHMNIAGIISEYNPFHTGHAYHIEETRRITGCDFVIAVMGGCFTQRGEPALFDKWVRTEMALRCGVDLVLELPALFAIRSADWFAQGGVSLLGSLNVVDTLSFGCETDSLPRLISASRLLEREPPEFRAALKARLAEGKSHARARGETLSEWLNWPENTFTAPNTALALEYLRVNRSLERPMHPLPIKRTNDYHDKTLSHYASASAIRHALHQGRLADVSAAMPEASARILEKNWPENAASLDKLDNILLHSIRKSSVARLSKLPDVSEGLEMRVKKLGATASSRKDLLEKLKCKRYTMARLSRLLTHAMLDMEEALHERYTVPPYARILGFRSSARPLLREIDRHTAIPLASDPMRMKDNPCFLLETQVTDLWALCATGPACRCAGRDYTERIIVL